MSPRLIEHELNDHTLFTLIKYAKYILWVHYRGVVDESEQNSRELAAELETAE